MSLAVLGTYCQATSNQWLQEGHLVIWMVFIPPISVREEFLLCSEKDIMWEINNSAQHSLIRHERWKATMFQIMTYSHERHQQPFLFRWNQPFIKCIKKCSTLYWLIIGMCQRTTPLDAAAHMVVYASISSGSVIVALCPKMLFLHLLI